METKSKDILLSKIGRICNAALKILVIIIFIFPFYWMVSTSLKDLTEALQFPPTLIPSSLHWENYVHVFETVPIARYFLNSVIVSIGVLVLQYLVIVPAAYSLARHEYRGKKLFFGLVLLGQMIPQQITFLPVYFMFSKVKLLGTLLPQILPFGASAFGIFMLRQGFKQIPDEIIESARLDSANEVQIMTQIALPKCKSSMITLAMFSFIGTWNSYFWPLVMTVHDEYRPLPVAIELLKSLGEGIEWPIIMAGNFLLVAPILIVFLIFSKKIIASMAYRGVK